VVKYAVQACRIVHTWSTSVRTSARERVFTRHFLFISSLLKMQGRLRALRGTQRRNRQWLWLIKKRSSTRTMPVANWCNFNF
jgi:hypothetical protein